MSNVAILGSGAVGDALAKGFLDNGFAVRRASRDPGKLEDWKKAAKGDASTGTFAEAAAWCELAVLRVKGSAAESLVGDLAGALEGKVVMDTTNPISEDKADNGVIRYFTNANESFICGNDSGAKETATGILTTFGWETVDIGGVEAARPIEALCQLWCAPGFLRNDWAHAFKYLKLG